MAISAPIGLALALALASLACQGDAELPNYRTQEVTRRDIVVVAEAAGVVEPDVTVEVKSKASGEILEIPVETGERVEADTLLVRVDQRQPRNLVALAKAELEVAEASRAIAKGQRTRAEQLFRKQSIAETEYEQVLLAEANAQAAVVRAQVELENAQIQLEDTVVRAPIAGTILEKLVERGQVISSPTQDVSGGTILMQMADLNQVRVRTLVDETDIGKLRAGLEARVRVAAYPKRPFRGMLLKIEPMAQTEQSVTMFAVLVRIDNREGLLRPGMNAEVAIQVGRRDQVLAVPNAALRTEGELRSTAELLGLDLSALGIEAVSGGPGRRGPSRAGAGSGAGDPTVRSEQPRRSEEPAGADASGRERPSRPEGSLAAGEPRRRRSGEPGAGRRRDRSRSERGTRYFVLAEREDRTEAVEVRTGLTDLDYIEVTSGLELGDRVLILPSASLLKDQQRMRERLQRITGGGLPGLGGRGH